MFQERDGEREILLGNKQLLGIFFVLAILFCVFFIAGYMVGHGTGGKNPVDTVAAAKPATLDNSEGQATAGETHAVTPDSSEGATESASSAVPEKPSPAATTHVASGTAIASKTAKSEADSEPTQSLTRPEEEQEPAHSRHTYLQVTALKHSEALKVAKILNRKGFHAQISPKAGTSLFRVLVGPVHTAGELNATRAALKNKGFREVFVQHL